VQLLASSFGAYDPAAHAVHDDEPFAAAKWPTAHEVQLASLSELAKPAGHGAHAEAPARDCLPAGHELQLEEPALAE
jgi:hypothetical protein